MPRFLSLSAATMALLPAVALGAHPAWHSSSYHVRSATSGWNLAATRHFGQPDNASGYSTILDVGSRIWAFGGSNPGGLSAPVAETLTGQRWSATSLPAGLSGFISDASAPASDDIWAISGYGRYVLRWDGARWRLVRSWGGQGILSGVLAVGPRDAWVFGTSATGVRSLGTWHYTGGRWRKVAGLAADIYRASATPRHEIWAIAAQPTQDVIVRLVGHWWRRVRAGSVITGVRWHDILAESANDVWLVGDTASADGSGRLELARWDGQGWRVYVTSLHGWAGRLAAAEPGQVLFTATSSGWLAAGIIATMSDGGHLSWSAIASSLGNGVSDVAFMPRTRSIWASGGILTNLGGNAVVWVRATHHAYRRAGTDSD